MKEEILLSIDGMSCKHCVKHIEDALKNVKGVKKISVSLENKSALIKGKDLDKEELIQAVKDAGYDAK